MYWNSIKTLKDRTVREYFVSNGANCASVTPRARINFPLFCLRNRQPGKAPRYTRRTSFVIDHPFYGFGKVWGDKAVFANWIFHCQRPGPSWSPLGRFLVLLRVCAVGRACTIETNLFMETFSLFDWKLKHERFRLFMECLVRGLALNFRATGGGGEKKFSLTRLSWKYSNFKTNHIPTWYNGLLAYGKVFFRLALLASFSDVRW